MIALKHYKELLFLICLLIVIAKSKKKYPEIQDVVSFSQIHDDTYYIPRVVKEIKSSINVEGLKRNEALFRRQIRQNLEDTVLLDRRLDTRRQQVFKIKKVKDLETLKRGYKLAIEYQFRTKILDCMLQLIYMARHYMKIFESKQFVDKTSTAYRIGYLARTLAYLYKKSTRLLEILNVRLSKNLWNQRGMTPAITLHHRVAKMHVDFDYYYLVLKRFHAKVRQLGNLPREKPPLKRHPQVW